jgi:plasmid stabilization system protein ParE
MAEISWTDEAQRWLNDIFEYIAADNPQTAARTVQGDLRRFPEQSVTNSHDMKGGSFLRVPRRPR